MKKLIKKFIKTLTPKFFLNIYDRYKYDLIKTRLMSPRECPICKYKGVFKTFGVPERIDAQCPNCNSLERHRLLFLNLHKKIINNENEDIKEPILHFAAEEVLENYFRDKYKNYKTADLQVTPDFTFSKKSDIQLNIENIEIPDNTFNTIIANHVLEHVDDDKASKEIYRVLIPKGIFIVMIPIIEGWEKTYEDKSITSENNRSIHYGQGDHVRYYGRDFRQRIEKNGLKLTQELTAEGKEVIKYGLKRGEKVFVFIKP